MKNLYMLRKLVFFLERYDRHNINSRSKNKRLFLTVAFTNSQINLNVYDFKIRFWLIYKIFRLGGLRKLYTKVSVFVGDIIITPVYIFSCCFHL